MATHKAISWVCECYLIITKGTVDGGTYSIPVASIEEEKADKF